jgi:hypothetical protein
VADLHLVVDLHARFDDGIGHRAAIDRRVRADLDVGPIDTPPTCGILTQLPVRASPSPTKSGAKPKPSEPITAPA